jgi:heavy metal sensor kinase
VFVRRETSPLGDYTVLVGASLDAFNRRQRLLERVLLTVVPLVVLLVGAVAWWAASAALRPVTAMAMEAERITGHSERWRLDVPATDDELGLLARGFNALLGRLSTASFQQRQFMADAAHELKTPVSVIRTATEVTHDRDDRTPAEYRDALVIVYEQSERLKRLVDDMLLLARADAGGSPVQRTLLYVDEIAIECARAASVVALAKGVSLTTDIDADLSFRGEADLLRRLMTNLLDNAITHTPAGGVVHLAAHADAGMLTISVADTGPGIAPADRERIFDRFVRLDVSRSSASGAGLGLPIARLAADQHGGTLTVDASSSGGGLFVARLPRVAPPTASPPFATSPPAEVPLNMNV